MRKKFAALAVVVLTLGLFVSSGQAYENCNGIGYYALQVPDPGSIAVDGLDGDWTWFDPDYVVGPDQMCNTLGNPIPPKSDIDIAIVTTHTFPKPCPQ